MIIILSANIKLNVNSSLEGQVPYNQTTGILLSIVHLLTVSPQLPLAWLSEQLKDHFWKCSEESFVNET